MQQGGLQLQSYIASLKLYVTSTVWVNQQALSKSVTLIYHCSGTFQGPMPTSENICLNEMFGRQERQQQ